jgi:hypothetical protein
MNFSTTRRPKNIARHFFLTPAARMLLDALNLNSVIETADSADFTDSSKTLKLGGSQRLCRLMKAGIGVLDDMLRMFPNLAARADTAAGVLSSGEQQMLTICRALMGDPDRRAHRRVGTVHCSAGRRPDRRDCPARRRDSAD